MRTDVKASDSPKVRKSRFTIDWKSIGYSAVMPVLAVVVALLAGAVMLLLLGVNPLEAYAAMITGVFGSVSGITQSLGQGHPTLAGWPGYLYCLPRQCDQHWRGRPNHPGGSHGHLVFLDFRYLARLAADPGDDPGGFHRRGVLGFHPRHPQSPLPGQ